MNNFGPLDLRAYSHPFISTKLYSVAYVKAFRAT